MEASFLSLFVTAALPVVNVFCMCALGAALAKKGILDGRGRQLLSQLIFWVFVPALTFTTLGNSVNLQNLKIWWILPVNVLASILIGLSIGWMSAKVLNVDMWFRNHFMCSAALGNVGNLPLVLVSSVCNANTPFAEALGGQCQRLGIAYIAFGMWIASIFQYCIAYNMMKKPTKRQQLHAQEARKVVLQLSAMPDHGQHGSAEAKEDAMENGEREESDEQPLIGAVPEVAAAECWEDEPCCSTPRQAAEGLERGHHYGAHQTSKQKNHRPNKLGTPLPGGQQCRLTKLKWIFWRVRALPWGSYLNCPTLAAAAGLTVGCVSILRQLLFGDSPPLLFVTQSLVTMAGGMIPCMMLLLGGSLAGGPTACKLPKRVIFGLIVVRLLVMPALGTGFVLLLLKSGIAHPPDILFVLSLLLCHCPPTAMNLQTVATLNQNGEEEMSSILCWQYLASLLTLPLWMLLFNYLIASGIAA